MRYNIRDRIIRYTGPSLIGDNADYIAEFEFDEEWTGKIKTARFEKDGTFIDQLLSMDKCTIPVEVLKGGMVRVGVYADKMATSYVEQFVKPSVLDKDGTPIPPSEDIYRQIIKMIEDMEKSEISEAQIEKAVSDYLEKNPIESGISEEQCQQIVADYFAAHKEELKGEKGDKGDKGDRGDDGIGVDGADGADGASAYDIAVIHGFIGTEEQWVASLHGKDGMTPVRGEDYWTAEDITQIQSYIDGQIGGALNGTY